MKNICVGDWLDFKIRKDEESLTRNLIKRKKNSNLNLTRCLQFFLKILHVVKICIHNSTRLKTFDS